MKNCEIQQQCLFHSSNFIITIPSIKIVINYISEHIGVARCKRKRKENQFNPLQQQRKRKNQMPLDPLSSTLKFNIDLLVFIDLLIQI